MRSSTLTSKGQITIPKAIREFLKVKSGDLIDFIIEGDNVLVRAGTTHLSELKGMLHQAGRKPVSLEEMDRAVVHHHRKRR
jgi:antitoxin PrlF